VRGPALNFGGMGKGDRAGGEYTAHLVVNMYALHGPPRITHLWGFANLEERGALRARSYAACVWPPHGGPEQIIEATSTIALP
jgi:NIPSNAP protein